MPLFRSHSHTATHAPIIAEDHGLEATAMAPVRRGHEGKGFADAVFAIWLGPKPPSENLKKGLLG